jgi:hypothetical protein
MEGDPTYEEEKNEFRFKVFSFHGYKKLNKAEDCGRMGFYFCIEG